MRKPQPKRKGLAGVPRRHSPTRPQVVCLSSWLLLPPNPAAGCLVREVAISTSVAEDCKSPRALVAVVIRHLPVVVDGGRTCVIADTLQEIRWRHKAHVRIPH